MNTLITWLIMTITAFTVFFITYFIQIKRKEISFDKNDFVKSIETLIILDILTPVIAGEISFPNNRAKIIFSIIGGLIVLFAFISTLSKENKNEKD